jgi:hypothetical protein
MEIPVSYYPILHLPSVKPCGLAILKKSGHNTQKWGIVGSDGLLRCFRYDNKVLQVRFLGEPASGKPEALISTGDQFVMSFDREIVQFTRKGVRTKIRDSPIENDISHLSFPPNQLIACSGSVCSIARPNTTHANLPSAIVGIAQLGSVSYLACADGSLHSFVSGQTHLVQRMPAPLTCLAAISRSPSQSFIAIGCADSVLRFFDVKEKIVSQVSLGAAATSIAAFDFDRDGFSELLVGLEDSTIVLINLALVETPKVFASLQLGFNVSNIAIGIIYSRDMVSALVTSQTGQVGIVFIEPKTDRSLLTGRTPKVTEQELDQLKMRVSELEVRARAANSRALNAPAEVNIEVKGDPISQKFVFMAESERPIARIALSASIPLTFSARSDCQAVISLSPPKPGKFAAVVRPIEATATRIAFDFAYETGAGGELACFLSYAKNSAVVNRTFPLKPFGLLKKLTEDPLAHIQENQLGVLIMRAGTSSSALRDLLDNCLPSVLEDDEPQSFASGPIGAVVTVVIHADSFIAKSIFFPIIVQLRTFILEKMNEKRQMVTFETKLGENCIHALFKQVKERLFVVMQAAALYFKLRALQEVRNSSPMGQFGDEETAGILHDAPNIERRFEGCKDEYNAYLTEIVGFYVEMWKKVSIDASGRVPLVTAALKEVRDDESLSALIELMKSDLK